MSITGAVHPADRPLVRRRSFWDAEKKLAVQEKREKPAAGGTVAAFCSMPMQGTRVVFVLDLSGSMTWPMEEQTTDKKRRRAVRLDFAKRELNQAMNRAVAERDVQPGDLQRQPRARGLEQGPGAGGREEPRALQRRSSRACAPTAAPTCGAVSTRR